MNNFFIILAAGKSKRFKAKLPKQYNYYKGKMIVEHSIEKAVSSKLFDKILLVISKSHSKFVTNINKKNISTIYGGKERKDSSLKALKYLRKYRPKNVFIHDAARPNFKTNLLKKINTYLNRYLAVVPYINTPNSTKLLSNGKIRNFDRSKILLTQTPQAFNFNELYKRSLKNKEKITDESSLYTKNKDEIKFVKDSQKNFKITKSQDIKNNYVKYGIGFDVHRLVPNRKLYLGGLKIKSNLGTLGHSDGDPVLHSIIDSILGACKMGDIGQKFSNKNKKYKNIRSVKLLKQVIKEINQKNYFINNLDINIITQTPKISKYKNKMVKVISKLCKISQDKINIKGKTTEKLGVIGREKAIACEVISSVIKYD
tara:strand:- start:1209 stop:2321 length:1113 start_codon:yes stop_codon:yes gene_type:complete